MKNYSVLGIICKALAALMLVLYLLLLIPVAPAGIGGLATILVALLWPALLWSVSELLDCQKRHERKLDRILELLGGGEDPEEEPDLAELEARLEKAMEEDTQAEPEEK